MKIKVYPIDWKTQVGLAFKVNNAALVLSYLRNFYPKEFPSCSPNT